MKIVIASRSTLGHHLGGMETYVDNQIRDFRQLGHKVSLLTSAGCSPSYLTSLSRLGVGVSYIEGNPPLRYSARWHAEVQRAVDRFESDVVIFHGVAGSRYSSTNRTSAITLTHGSALTSLYNSSLAKRPVRSTASRLLAMARYGEVQGLRSHTLIALSDFDAKLTALATFQSKARVRVIPPPIPMRQSTSSRERIIVFAGRIEAIKGVEDILNAWSRIETPHYRLVLAGKGSQLSQLQSRFAGNHQVSFAGSLSQAQLASLFSSARWVVSAGRVLESFGLAAAEALASGTPVLYPRRGALPETVGRAGIGYRGVRGLCQALKSAVTMPDSDWDEFHRLALTRAADFAPESSLALWESLLNDVVRRAG